MGNGSIQVGLDTSFFKVKKRIRKFSGVRLRVQSFRGFCVVRVCVCVVLIILEIGNWNDW